MPSHYLLWRYRSGFQITVTFDCYSNTLSQPLSSSCVIAWKEAWLEWGVNCAIHYGRDPQHLMYHFIRSRGKSFSIPLHHRAMLALHDSIERFIFYLHSNCCTSVLLKVSCTGRVVGRWNDWLWGKWVISCKIVPKFAPAIIINEWQTCWELLFHRVFQFC